MKKHIWYISPSSQVMNLGAGDYGTEMEQMRLLAEAIVPHLDRAGVSFHLADEELSLGMRVEESNSMDTCFHLALHSNAGGRGKARGPVAYYYSEAGRAFGEKVVRELLDLGQESNRASNLNEDKKLYETRATRAPACLLEVDFHDNPAGAEFIMTRRQDIAQAIAKAIIHHDGKEFVSLTDGECVDESVRLGLFDPGTRWDEPITAEDAAKLAVRLIGYLQRR